MSNASAPNHTKNIKSINKVLSKRHDNSLSIDNGSGDALTFLHDEILGALSSANILLPDVTTDNNNKIAFTQVNGGFCCDDFRVVADLSGSDVDVEIWTQQVTEYIANYQLLNEGQIATPVSGYATNIPQFVRVKKGLGQGQLKIEAQIQNPITKDRVRVPIEIIDLDDGLSARDYDLLLPQCSAMTMNGHTKLSDSVAVNWIIKAEVGVVQVLGAGVNPQNKPPIQIYKETVLGASLPVSGTWRSPEFSEKNINRILFYIKQKVAGDIATARNVKVEVKL